MGIVLLKLSSLGPDKPDVEIDFLNSPGFRGGQLV